MSGGLYSFWPGHILGSSRKEGVNNKNFFLAGCHWPYETQGGNGWMSKCDSCSVIICFILFKEILTNVSGNWMCSLWIILRMHWKSCNTCNTSVQQDSDKPGGSWWINKTHKYSATATKNRISKIWQLGNFKKIYLTYFTLDLLQITMSHITEILANACCEIMTCWCHACWTGACICVCVCVFV